MTDQPSTPSFIHLRVHSEFSLADGIVRVGELASRCEQLGYPAAAITDVSNFFATIKQYRAFHRAGLKPIIGAELWVQYSDEPQQREKLVFLAETDQGYVHLCELISEAYLHNHHDEWVAIRFEWLAERHDGLIVLSGGPTTLLGELCIRQNLEAAIQHVAPWRSLFGDRYFIELQRLGHAYESAYEAIAIQVAVEKQIPVVATNDVRFVAEQDFDAHEVRYCINNGYQLADEGNFKRPRPYTPQQYIKSPEQMAALFADIPQALENSVIIARRCNVTIELDKPVLPAFDVPIADMSEADYLRKLSHDGLVARLVDLFPDELERAEVREKYTSRLDVELDTIISMGFPGYFLIVADFIQWAKAQKIPVGPGRGSGAGSLVAYALQITNIDPLPYDLLFERFLNPERVSMPDFDIDFCMDQRDDVIRYVAQKYGQQRVSQISTHGSMMARAVVRDVGRVMGFSYGAVDRIAKLIPGKPGTKLRTVMLGKDSDNEKLAKDFDELYASNTETIDELHDRYAKDTDDIKQLIDMALRLEGIARNVGKHAGGVVIAPSAITDFSPLYCDSDGHGIITQYDKDDVEAAGLVKFDFLGLRTLTILDWAVADVNQKRATRNEPPVNLDLLPLDDPKPYSLIQKAQTTAVFQLESPGMKRIISGLKPENFEEIIALVALYRPGPLDAGMTDDFINRKHGLAKVEYLHPTLTEMLKPILEPTYGVIVYQEQVMQIGQVMAGYSLGGADLLRRAMGKKKPEEMAKQKVLFVEGSSKNGISEDISTFVFDSIEKFAGYGFNKSHSAGYALVAYHTAWLKYYYPAEFMAAVLSSDMDKTDKVVTFIEECRAMKIEILPPHVNHSAYKFLATEAGIRFGMGAIKGVGEAVITAIVEERQRGGAFRDIFEFCQRLPQNTLNKKSLEALTLSGALDDMGSNRASTFAAMGEALKLAQQYHKDQSSGQMGLFGEMEATIIEPPQLKPHPEWPTLERLDKEKNALGLFLSDHPINDYQHLIGQLSLQHIGDLVALGEDPQQINALRDQPRQVAFCGYVLSAQRRQTKNGKMMTSIKLDDRTGQLEIVIFDEEPKNQDTSAANASEQTAAPPLEINTGEVIVLEAQLSYNAYRQELRFKPSKKLNMQDAQEQYCRAIRIRLSPMHGAAVVQRVHQAIAAHQGGHAGVQLQYESAAAIAQFRLGERWLVQPTETLLNELAQAVGHENLGYQYRTFSLM